MKKAAIRGWAGRECLPVVGCRGNHSPLKQAQTHLGFFRPIRVSAGMNDLSGARRIRDDT